MSEAVSALKEFVRAHAANGAAAGSGKWRPRRDPGDSRGDVQPSSRFGPLFGATANDLRAAVTSLDGSYDRPLLVKVLKRSIDLVLGMVLLLLSLPIMVALVVAIRLGSRGPAIFRQVRVGLHGRTYTMYKFRTMSAEGDPDLAELVAPTTVHNAMFKVRVDPRVTPLGRYLRRYSLDELPQLMNVLRGEMSLVGPRPPLPAEVDRYDRLTSRRLSVMPGITGLWQVSGRSDLSWEETVRLETRYVDEWTIALEFEILARTPWAVLSHRGAY